jgi:hypothetical protein
MSLVNICWPELVRRRNIIELPGDCSRLGYLAAELKSAVPYCPPPAAAMDRAEPC